MILLKGGITIEEALKKLEQIIHEPGLKNKISQAVIMLKQGISVQNAVDFIGIFNPKELSLITISESISNPIEGFIKIYQETESELEQYLEKLMKLIEPVVMLVIGLLIFVMMYMVISPTMGVVNKME
jgi:type II secretory pathway component PulF